jgi:hypothetical protein
LVVLIHLLVEVVAELMETLVVYQVVLEAVELEVNLLWPLDVEQLVKEMLEELEKTVHLLPMDLVVEEEPAELELMHPELLVQAEQVEMDQI